MDTIQTAIQMTLVKLSKAQTLPKGKGRDKFIQMVQKDLNRLQSQVANGV